jgi:hypothetical protein
MAELETATKPDPTWPLRYSMMEAGRMVETANRASEGFSFFPLRGVEDATRGLDFATEFLGIMQRDLLLSIGEQIPEGTLLPQNYDPIDAARLLMGEQDRRDQIDPAAVKVSAKRLTRAQAIIDRLKSGGLTFYKIPPRERRRINELFDVGKKAYKDLANLYSNGIDLIQR